MDEYFHEADQAGMVDFDSCNFGMAGNNREGQALEQREIHMDLEGLCLKGGETVSDGKEMGSYRCQMLDSLFKEEVFEVIATEFDSQEVSEFFILFDKGMFEVGS
jgi:hypothetical protein